MSQSRLERFEVLITDKMGTGGAYDALSQMPRYWNRMESQFWSSLEKQGASKHTADIYNALVKSQDLATQAVRRLGVETANRVLDSAYDELVKPLIEDLG